MPTPRPSASPTPTATHLFFPDPLPTETATPFPSTATAGPTASFLYGWVKGTTVVVAGALDAASWEDARQRVDKAAEFFPGTDALGVVGMVCSCDGPLNEGSGGASKSRRAKAKGKVEVVATGQRRALRMHLSVDGVPSVVCDESMGDVTPVFYTPPSRSNLQFFSLVPLQLDLNVFSSPGRSAMEVDASKEDQEESKLGDKIRHSVRLDFSSASRRSVRGITNLERVVDWINLSSHLTLAVSPSQSRRPSLPPMRPLFSSSPTFFHHPMRFVGLLAQAAIAFANWEIPMLEGTAPKDFSATIQQIDTRLSQALSWPSQFSLIRQTLDNLVHTPEAASLPAGRAHYIQFYNTLWLIANDIIVGSAFTSFFCENCEYLGHALGNVIQVYTLDRLRELLLWLNDWPGGVKLNFELATVFCNAFLWGTGLWEELIFTPVRPYLPLMVYVVGVSGLLGTTMFISATSDLLSLLTFHVFVFYLMVTSLFRWHLSMLGALFNIFRGKKYNVLRHRVEPASYSVDQLLLGTIFFTLAAFLFPTVLAYYLAFAAARLAIVALHAGMETVLAFMNHFPLFAVMLRFKDPGRLPGGLQFELKAGLDGKAAYLRVINAPVHLAGIFFQHLKLSRRLASHYSPIYLLGRLLTGRLISPIPRVRLRLWVDVHSPHRAQAKGDGELGEPPRKG